MKKSSTTTDFQCPFTFIHFTTANLCNHIPTWVAILSQKSIVNRSVSKKNDLSGINNCSNNCSLISWTGCLQFSVWSHGEIFLRLPGWKCTPNLQLEACREIVAAPQLLHPIRFESISLPRYCNLFSTASYRLGCQQR